MDMADVDEADSDEAPRTPKRRYRLVAKTPPSKDPCQPINRVIVGHLFIDMDIVCHQSVLFLSAMS